MKSIGIIALDLDGTLLDSQKRLSGRNKEACSDVLTWELKSSLPQEGR